MIKNSLLFLGLIFLTSATHAESVSVKYGGEVKIDSFSCEWVSRSSFIKRLCYDPKESYVIVLLSNTYYHYCGVPAGIVSSWSTAASMGRFYNANVKGRYDCRVNHLPKYE